MPHPAFVRRRFRLVRVLCFAACALVATARALFAQPVPSLAARLEELRPHLAEPSVRTILDHADRIARGPIYARAADTADMAGKPGFRVGDARDKSRAVLRNGLKWTDDPAEIARRAEQFALASSDTLAARKMLEELPLLAAACRLADAPDHRDYLVRQLREVVSWSPFQRPGWTIPSRNDAFPADGDGAWLATGALLQALALMNEILPPDALPPDLRAALRERVSAEVAQTRRDWTERLPWYVRAEAVHSNQWVVPASGMLAGAVLLGEGPGSENYDLAADALRRSLAVTGADGSMSEGYTYAMTWTSASLLLARHFAARAGDPGFADHPFFQNFPGYLALYLQPGGNLVNVSDAFPAQRGFLDGSRTELTRAAALAGSPALDRVVAETPGGPSSDFFGLLLLGRRFSGPPAAHPPAWGLFERTRLFVWRSSWDADASGIWIRGGDAADFHDNHDRGHVNFVVRGAPVLIEAGTPGYSHPHKQTDYDSALGHNVLRLGDDIRPVKAPAPLVLVRADASGGEVRADLSLAYPRLASCERTVTWDHARATVRDVLRARPGDPVPPRATWHLASAEQPVIERPAANRAVARVPAGRMVFPAWIGEWNREDRPAPVGEDVLQTPAIRIEIEADRPFTLTASRRPDHTLKFRRFENLHSTLEFATDADVDAIEIVTRVIVE